MRNWPIPTQLCLQPFTNQGRVLSQPMRDNDCLDPRRLGYRGYNNKTSIALFVQLFGSNFIQLFWMVGLCAMVLYIVDKALRWIESPVYDQFYAVLPGLEMNNPKLWPKTTTCQNGPEPRVRLLLVTVRSSFWFFPGSYNWTLKHYMQLTDWLMGTMRHDGQIVIVRYHSDVWQWGRGWDSEEHCGRVDLWERMCTLLL